MQMNYEEARAYLNQISKSGSVLGLETIKSLMEELGNPQHGFRIVHIAGTNGKGSILTYTANIMRAAGHRVGTYTSPAVMGYEERYQVNCEWMPKDDLAPIVCEVKAAAEAIVAKGAAMPTVFEFETAIAFVYFKKKACEFVVLETGLGGDLDSTNVVDFTEVCAFASISMDHMDILGDTLDKIAACKAGIIKPGSEVILGWQQPDAEDVLREAAERQGADIIEIDKGSLHETDFLTFDYKWHKGMKISLLGQHQLENATVAIEIADYLAISEDAIRVGLEEARWPGRFELLSIEGEPMTIIDGAHNVDAARRLAEGIKKYFPNRRIYAVLGMFKDKAYEDVADVLAPVLSGGYAIDIEGDPRSLDKETLEDVYCVRGVDVAAMYDLEEAIEEAMEDARRNGGVVLITGSLSYLAKARTILLRRAKPEMMN